MQGPPTLRADACCSDSEDKFQYKINDKDKTFSVAWHGLDRWAADHMHWVQGKLKGAYLRFVLADERHLVEHVQAGKYSRQGHV